MSRGSNLANSVSDKKYSVQENCIAIVYLQKENEQDPNIFLGGKLLLRTTSKLVHYGCQFSAPTKLNNTLTDFQTYYMNH